MEISIPDGQKMSTQRNGYVRARYVQIVDVRHVSNGLQFRFKLE